MPDEAAEPVRINRDLYARLRDHCDRLGIRFNTFTEDALENAISTEITARALEQELEGLRAKAERHDYAFNLGFRKGFAFLHLMLQGLSASAATDEDLAVIRKHPAAAIKGEQVKLF